MSADPRIVELTAAVLADAGPEGLSESARVLDRLVTEKLESLIAQGRVREVVGLDGVLRYLVGEIA